MFLRDDVFHANKDNRNCDQRVNKLTRDADDLQCGKNQRDRVRNRKTRQDFDQHLEVWCNEQQPKDKQEVVDALPDMDSSEPQEVDDIAHQV